ncbi:hypothetical protein [Vibrio sp. D431a]|uniref:hypothetical protein n=1 Tax=Vibrio sp. D431a TaxID=2837388 RepID=UPI00255671D5|nr:hypothetical protein [Vibrio sp. D431a]MDK9790667.1 hypothetical protein [Vibrio sp. D431a]
MKLKLTLLALITLSGCSNKVETEFEAAKNENKPIVKISFFKGQPTPKKLCESEQDKLVIYEGKQIGVSHQYDYVCLKQINLGHGDIMLPSVTGTFSSKQDHELWERKPVKKDVIYKNGYSRIE